MEICDGRRRFNRNSFDHPKIVHDETTCPMCDLLEEKEEADEALEAAKERIEELEREEDETP